MWRDDLSLLVINIPSSPAYGVLSLNLYDTPGLAPRMNVLFWGPGDFPVSYSNRDTSRNAQEVLWSIWGSYSAIWSIPLTNVKWHSDPWPTVTSQPIRLSTNFMTLIPSLTFTDYKWFPWSICNGCGMPAGNAYPSGHLVPSPILGLANAPIVETKFLELAMSLLDFSPRIPLGTFSILPFTIRGAKYLCMNCLFESERIKLLTEILHHCKD